MMGSVGGIHQPGEGGAALGDADIDMTAFGRDVSRLINRNINGEAVSPFLLWERRWGLTHLATPRHALPGALANG